MIEDKTFTLEIVEEDDELILPIPDEIAEYLQITENSSVEFILLEDNMVLITKVEEDETKQ